MKPQCPSIDLTHHVLFFSLPTLHRNISTHLMFEYEIHLFEPQIETNFQCVFVYLNLGRNMKCFYFVSEYFEKVSLRIKDETLRIQYYLISVNVALWTFGVTLQSDIFYSSSAAAT